jgi:hypothetical protein
MEEIKGACFVAFYFLPWPACLPALTNGCIKNGSTESWAHPTPSVENFGGYKSKTIHFERNDIKTALSFFSATSAT